MSAISYARAVPPRCILGLHSKNVLQDILVGENPAMTQTFGNQFFKVNGNYPAMDFRALGWIHRNFIVPSTLHQVMKYVDGDGKVRTLIAKSYPFKGQ